MSNSKFSGSEGAAWGKLLNVHAAMMRRLEEMLQAQYQISHGEFEVLLRLSWANGQRMRIRDLAEASVLTHSGMSRLVERLVRVGLVGRESAAEDGRGAYAVLTAFGQERLIAAEASDISLVKEYFLSLYSQPELAQMASFWERFLENEKKLTRAEAAKI